MDSGPPQGSLTLNFLAEARQVIATERRTLELIETRLDESFCAAVELIRDRSNSQGSVIVTGMGKAGHIAAKMAATMASTGTRAHHVHPGEAVHGDLGRIGPQDVVIALSYSGETDEIVKILRPVRDIGAALVAITSKADSTLARAADHTIVLGPIEEACPLGLAPSASTTAMMAVGDAIAFVLSKNKQFQAENFAQFHPAGSLGKLTGPVDDVMRTGQQLRIAPLAGTVRESLVETHKGGRRTGAILVTDNTGRLAGIFTDGDLARLLEKTGECSIDEPISSFMNSTPTVVQSGCRLSDAIDLLCNRKFSQLPVLSDDRVPIGIIDITDLLGLIPDADNLDPVEQSTKTRRAA